MEENPQIGAPPLPQPADRFGRANWLLLGAGAVLLLLGFLALAFADERAANLPGRLAPFIILGGYVVIFLGLVKK